MQEWHCGNGCQFNLGKNVLCSFLALRGLQASGDMGEQSKPRIGRGVSEKHADTWLLFTAELAIVRTMTRGCRTGRVARIRSGIRLNTLKKIRARRSRWLRQKGLTAAYMR